MSGNRGGTTIPHHMSELLEAEAACAGSRVEMQSLELEEDLDPEYKGSGF